MNDVNNMKIEEPDLELKQEIITPGNEELEYNYELQDIDVDPLDNREEVRIKEETLEVIPKITDESHTFVEQETLLMKPNKQENKWKYEPENFDMEDNTFLKIKLEQEENELKCMKQDTVLMCDYKNSQDDIKQQNNGNELKTEEIEILIKKLNKEENDVKYESENSDKEDKTCFKIVLEQDEHELKCIKQDTVIMCDNKNSQDEMTQQNNENELKTEGIELVYGGGENFKLDFEEFELNIVDHETNIEYMEENSEVDVSVALESEDASVMKQHYSSNSGDKLLDSQSALHALKPTQGKQVTELNRQNKFKHTAEKPFKCTKCSYAGKQVKNLRRHMLKHTAEKPYKCTKCSYECKHVSSLKSHMLIHTGEKPYKCTKCSYECRHVSSLKSHMLTHTAEKPYKCTKCSYESKYVSSLKSHMLTHTSEKLFKCTKCSYAGKQVKNLRSHMLKHTAENPYKCTKCSYECKRVSSLKSHMLTHTGEKPYKCTKCSYECKNVSSLKSHMLTGHSVKI